MNTVLHSNAALFEDICQFAHSMLRLRSCQAVTRNEHDFIRVSKLSRNVVHANLAHRSFMSPRTSNGRCTSESPKQDVRHRAIHRAAHQDRKYEPGETVERAGNDQDFVIEDKSSRG